MIRKLFSPRRITAAHAFFLGALLAAVSLLPALLPFGGRFVTRGDFIEQQLPFIVETKRLITQGAGYSFSTFLGAPAVGSYAFYTLGSVFVWPLALLPMPLIPFGIGLMAILKIACGTAIAFCYFRRMLRSEAPALLGGVLYMFSAFTVVNTQFYHFTEVIAFFPLILLGIEIALSDSPKPGLLALFCGVNALTNYYFMLSSALLAALYFIFRFFSEDVRPYRSMRRAAAVVFECGVGCALSGVLLLPAMHYMLSISRGGMDVQQLLTPYSLQILLERLRALLMPIESGVVHAFFGEAGSWTSTAAYLPVFGLTGVIVFLRVKGSRWLKALLAALLLCSVVPALCGAFALFTNPAYTRWWYGLALMMTLATLKALESIPLTDRIWKLSLSACAAVSALLVLPSMVPTQALERIGASLLLSFRGGAYASVPLRIAALALAALGFGAMLLLICRPLQKRAILALVCVTACVQYAVYIAAGDTLILSGGTQPQNGVYTLEEIASPMLGALETDVPEDFVRIDHGRKLRNYGLIRGQSALTSFSSLRPGLVNRFAEMAGFGYSQSPTVSPPDASGAIRALLSVKEYHQLDSEDVPEGFIYDREENGISVYRNENHIPMGFLQTVCTGTHDQPMQPEDVAKTMLAAATLEPSQMAKLANRMQKLNVHAIPDWKDSVSRLQGNACDLFKTNPDGFTAHISAKQAGLLIFTIPYDRGFTASVNGQESEIYLCDVAFMGVWVEAGENDVVFTYRTRSLDLGIVMSAAAALTLLAYCFIARRKLSKTA